MKNLFMVGCFFLLVSNSLTAQTGTGWGVKGGLNYGSSGDLNLIENIEAAARNPDENLGWHLGVYGKLGNRFYLRPELIYTHLNSAYGNSKFKMQKLDLPVLAGFNLIGPLHIFAGPAFQYILDTDLENVSLGEIENNFTIGFNVGAGINLGKLGVDLRYERGFSKNEADIIGQVTEEIIGRIDTRPEQLILCISYKLN